MRDDSGAYHTSLPAGDVFVNNRLDRTPLPNSSDGIEHGTSNESTDDRVELPITSAGARGRCASLLLPCEMFDALSASEKATLPSLFHRFMTSRAFRSTLNYDLQRVDNPPAVCTPELLNAAHSVSEPASDQFRFARDSSPIVCRFPLMDLPAELRVMIATYVLYVPEGHEWTWTTYRRRRHVATLQGCGLGEKPEELNALALTCRVIHQEIKGLILKINVIRFSLHKSHSYVISEICRGYIRASDHDLWGFQEALQLFQLCNLRECRPNARRFELIYYYSIQHLEKSLDQFLDVTNGQQELKISVVLEEWVVAPLDDDERRELVGLEEDGEPFVPESEQMQKRVSDYMQEGNQVQDFVERVGGENRNWRFFPNLVSKHEALDLSKIMTPEVETMTKEWETNGVQKWASGEVLSALCSRVWFRPNVLSVVSEL